ncbi:MAG: fibronectin type III domain-containing protein [Candidatus Brocadiia bacterium]
MPKRLILGFLLTSFLALGYGGLCDNSKPSEESLAGSSAPLPSAVSSLRASANYTAITLDWQDNSNSEDGVKIERSTDGVSFTQLALTGADVITYVDSGLAPGVTYYYRVRAYNSNGDSMYSNSASAGTPALPAAPANLVAVVVSASQINLNWADGTADETGFRLERSADGTGFVMCAVLPANTVSYSDSGLNDATLYYYRVRVRNPSGDSDYSGVASAATPFSSPSQLNSAVINYAGVNLAWTDNSGKEDGFQVERKTGSGGAFVQIAQTGANAVTYSDTGLMDGTVYSYRVRGCSAALGQTAYTNESSITTPLQPPSALNVAVISSSQINLAWTDNSANETGYKVERKTGSSSVYSQISALGADAVAYSDTGLVDGDIYYYRVWACNANTSSAYSNEASEVIALNAPTVLTATTVTVDQINLIWIDNSVNESGFQLERSADGVSFTQIAATGVNVNYHADFGLAENTVYYYRVRAHNPNDQSGYSNILAVATALKTPSNLTAVVISATAIALTWTDNSNYEDGFKIERKTGSGGVYAVILTTAVADITAFTDTGLAKGNTYYYRVKAVNNITKSDYSNETSAYTNYWTLKNPTGILPSARTQFSMVWDGTKAIMFGGYDGSQYLDDLWWYYPATNTWVEKIALNSVGSPTAREKHQMVWDGQNIILFGGVGVSGGFTDLWWYDPWTNTWTQKIANLMPGSPQSIFGHSMVWDGTRVILFSGGNAVVNNNELWWYEPITNTWTQKIPNNTAGSPPARYYHAMVWGGVRIILFGGYQTYSDWWWYDPTLNIWTVKIQTGGLARQYHTMAWDGANVLIFGGSDNTGCNNDLWLYNPNTNSYVERIPKDSPGSPSARVFSKLIWDGTKGILFGGTVQGSPDTYKNDIWWYEP